MWSNISAPTSQQLTIAAEAQVQQSLAIGSKKQEEFSNENSISNDNVTSQNQNHSGSPLMRYKHAVCSAPSSGYIYIHGGRFGNLPLDDDIWRFDPHQNNWLQLNTIGSCKPPSLQEHTLVEYNDRLYLFGGQVSTSNTESSFWCLDLMNNEWRSLSMKSSKFGAHLGPTNRRGHSAVVYGHSMYIYGGFEDFRGSSGQLWEYDLRNERWELRNLSSRSAVHPDPRHGHSAIVFETNMYIYGGLSNLKPLNDLWRWSWRDKRWFKERTKGKSPGYLHGHTAIQAFGSMFVFGGERGNGRVTRSLWRLNLSNMTWQKVRPKGPRPSPTTWHGAIANPLSILDETNYIIEGDNEHQLVLSTGGSRIMETNFISSPEHQTGDDDEDLKRISHSKSSNIEVVNRKSSSVQPKTTSTSTTKRKSRLSFLRKSRPKSTYELKQIQMSSSVNNFSTNNNSQQQHQTNRHSIHVAQTSIKSEQSSTNDRSNVKILDNLDTDIKEMFQRAMSPIEDNGSLMKQEEEGEEGEEEPMSVDHTSIEKPSISCTTNTDFLNRSHYDTATGGLSNYTDADDYYYPKSKNPPISQRTSYAYTTPPSELNTHLTQANDSSTSTINNNNSANSNEKSCKQLNLFRYKNLQPSANRRYDKRDNRPKSEIVQSLIERADEGIETIYTAFFNQTSNGSRRQNNNHQVNRLSLNNKSKRHTIPQTMTYYNLYFSEDKSSNSPPTSGSQDEEESARKMEQTAANMMTRDDVSSSTLRGLAAGENAPTTSNGTLIGVHGYLNPAILAQMDQVSQLSLETLANNSSESRTICANNNNSEVRTNGGSNMATFSAISSLQSSLPNALTARRETATESSDNTSLSFSMIAEFEEDDMLQYSSPTDPINIRPLNSNCFTGHLRPEERFTTTNNEVNIKAEEVIERGREMMAHKSASSGYDSISGSFEKQSNSNVTPSSQKLSNLVAEGNYHDNCIRKEVSQHTYTSEVDTTNEEMSSVGTESSFNYSTTNTTSPEQSAYKKNQHKKLKGRTFLNNQSQVVGPTTTTSSSITNDSLALTTSDAFECSSSQSIIDQQHQKATVTKSLPNSPPDNNNRSRLRSNELNLDNQNQIRRKISLMSRSKLFGKQKSKTRYWQLCMFVIGGKQDGAHGINEPITIWRLYI